MEKFGKYSIQHDEFLMSWKVFFENKKIGEFEFEEDEQGRIWASNLSIDEPFQRKGIGTYLIARAVECYDAVYFFTGTRLELNKKSESGDYDSRYLSIEGAALLNYCLKKGIIKKEWALNPYQKDESESYE